MWISFGIVVVVEGHCWRGEEEQSKCRGEEGSYRGS